jgi:hypothetical protein
MTAHHHRPATRMVATAARARLPYGAPRPQQPVAGHRDRSADEWIVPVAAHGQRKITAAATTTRACPGSPRRDSFWPGAHGAFFRRSTSPLAQPAGIVRRLGRPGSASSWPRRRGRVQVWTASLPPTPAPAPTWCSPALALPGGLRSRVARSARRPPLEPQDGERTTRIEGDQEVWPDMSAGRPAPAV